MTRKEAVRLNHQEATLASLGINRADAASLRRISMTLRRWLELECGSEHGAVERDEKTGRCYWRDSFSGRRSLTTDRETGALKRLSDIMVKYPSLQAYVQGDCRGCALYILRPGDVPDGANVASYYSRGIAVY